MKKYNVAISKKALTDMEDIYDYISNVLESPSSAMRLYNKIADAIESLEYMPERCKLIEDEILDVFHLRQILVENYTVLYMVLDDTVSIVRVLYSSSDIASRLIDGK